MKGEFYRAINGEFEEEIVMYSSFIAIYFEGLFYSRIFTELYPQNISFKCNKFRRSFST